MKTGRPGVFARPTRTSDSDDDSDERQLYTPTHHTYRPPARPPARAPARPLAPIRTPARTHARPYPHPHPHPPGRCLAGPWPGRRGCGPPRRARPGSPPPLPRDSDERLGRVTRISDSDEGLTDPAWVSTAPAARASDSDEGTDSRRDSDERLGRETRTRDSDEALTTGDSDE